MSRKTGLSRQSVHHADTERGKRVPVTGLRCEKAECLPGECVERLFRREVSLVTRYAGPIESRKVGRVVVRCTFHQCQCTSHVILHPAEFVPVFRPCDDVAMAAHGLQSVAVRLIQVFIQPLLVDLDCCGCTVKATACYSPPFLNRERLFCCCRL